jgi:hypothetical protein
LKFENKTKDRRSIVTRRRAGFTGCGKSALVVILILPCGRRIPPDSRQKSKRDSSRKIGAQNDNLQAFSANWSGYAQNSLQTFCANWSGYAQIGFGVQIGRGDIAR